MGWWDDKLQETFAAVTRGMAAAKLGPGVLGTIVPINTIGLVALAALVYALSANPLYALIGLALGLAFLAYANERAFRYAEKNPVPALLSGTESLSTIDFGLRELLADPKRRDEFFKAITQDEVASQIRALRKKRALTQQAFAKLAEMNQSAVSRIEQADYSSWTLTTLFKVATALDARWHIILQPAEEAIAELEQAEAVASEPAPLGDAARARAESGAAPTKTLS